MKFGLIIPYAVVMFSVIYYAPSFCLEGLEKPPAYEKPKNPDQARDQLDEAQRNIEEADRAKKDADQKMKDAVAEQNKIAKDKAKGIYSDEWKAANKRYEDALKKSTDAKEIKQQWQDRQKELEKYVEALGPVQTKPIESAPQEERPKRKVPERLSDVVALSFDIANRTPEIRDLIAKNPTGFRESNDYQTFIDDLRALELVTDPTSIAMRQLRDSFQMLHEAQFQGLFIDRTMPFNDQSVSEWALLSNEYLKKDKAYADALETIIDDEGRAVPQRELGGQKPLMGNFTQKRLIDTYKTKINDLVKNIAENPQKFTSSYNTIDQQIRKWLDVIDNAAVTPESLKAREWIRDEFYNRIREETFRQGVYLSIPTLINLDVETKLVELDKKIALDRSLLVATVEGPRGTEFQLVQAAARPPSMDDYVYNIIERQRAREQALKQGKKDRQNKILETIVEDRPSDDLKQERNVGIKLGIGVESPLGAQGEKIQDKKVQSRLKEAFDTFWRALQRIFSAPAVWWKGVGKKSGSQVGGMPPSLR